MSNFSIAYAITLGHEGSYVNDPNDMGGETYQGITKRYYGDWEGWDIINKMKVRFTDRHQLSGQLDQNEDLQKQVRALYKAEFWDKMKGDDISEQLIANELFDTGVNIGKGDAVKCFQRALNLLNKMGKDYADISDDGGLGPISVATFNAYMGTADKYRGRTREMNVRVLLKAMNGEQYMEYKGSVEKREKQELYFYGWVANRIGSIE